MRDTGKNWKEAARELKNKARRWTGEDGILAGMDEGEVNRARTSGWSEKRRFDSLGGGLIPMKRAFDSLGLRIIPSRKRKWRPEERDSGTATKDYMVNHSIGDKAGRKFDSIGGGLIPPRKRQPSPHKTSTGNKGTARKYYGEDYSTVGDKTGRRFDSIGGGIIPP